MSLAMEVAKVRHRQRCWVRACPDVTGEDLNFANALRVLFQYMARGR